MFLNSKWLKKPDKKAVTPIYQQIKANILKAIEQGNLDVGHHVPSINKLCQEFKLAPGTVIKAYEELREMGVMSSRQGKGYFISSTNIEQKTKIFLLFDRMNAFKEILYDAFRNEFKDDTDIQVFFHHYNSRRFEKIIRENLGKFSHYVLMPHLHENVQKIIQRIPEKKLTFIDNFPGNLYTSANAVFQDFYQDIFGALEKRIEEINCYEIINLSLSQSKFQFVPEGTREGFLDFCRKYKLNHQIIQSITMKNLIRNGLYIVFDDREMVNTIKTIQSRHWEFKKDIGLISFDDSPVKEILGGGISVLSTDFVKMGITAADMVKGKIQGQLVNPFQLKYRNSF